MNLNNVYATVILAVLLTTSCFTLVLYFATNEKENGSLEIRFKNLLAFTNELNPNSSIWIEVRAGEQADNFTLRLDETSEKMIHLNVDLRTPVSIKSIDDMGMKSVITVSLVDLIEGSWMNIYASYNLSMKFTIDIFFNWMRAK